jgi:hypothetical protein
MQQVKAGLSDLLMDVHQQMEQKQFMLNIEMLYEMELD